MRKLIVAYCRASSEESQNRQHNAIPAQRSRIERWSKINDATILRVFKERASGKDFERPEFKKMWSYVRDNKDAVTHVICAEVTRFGREGADYLKWFKKFEKIGVNVNFSDEWIDFSIPEMYSLFYYRIGTAEAERLRIGKRTRDTKREIRRAGYYADSPPAPWRYAEERDQSGRKHLISREPYFTAYQRAVNMFSKSGYGQTEVLEILELRDMIKTSTFSRLIRNPLIAGYIPIWGNGKRNTERPLVDIVKGKVEPLVSWETYQRIQEKLKDIKSKNINKQNSYFRPEFPFKKVIKCDVCNNPLTAYNSKGKSGKLFPYYDCRRKDHKNRLNANKAHELMRNILDSFTIKKSEQHLIEMAAQNAMNKLGMSTSKRSEQITKDIQLVNQKINKLKNDYLKLDTDVFSELMLQFKQEKLNLETAKQSFDNQKTIGIQTKQKLVGLLDNFGQIFSDCTPLQQHEMMRMVFPEGFTMKKNEVRTPRINQILDLICYIPRDYIDKNKKSDGEPSLFVAADAGGKYSEHIYSHDLYLVREFILLKESA